MDDNGDNEDMTLNTGPDLEVMRLLKEDPTNPETGRSSSRNGAWTNARYVGSRYAKSYAAIRGLHELGLPVDKLEDK